jgi:glycosyltransferase involved in cell wall biosynthesis
MSPSVSVVIPVHNRESALRCAIASVLKQTWQDFELIVVDDGSTDRSAAVAAAVGDSRIKVVRHPSNRGGSAARNTGVRVSQAEFIAFLDSDDEWLPEKTERQLRLFERSPSDLALVYAGVERVYGDGTVTRQVPVPPKNVLRALVLDNVIGETSVAMVRRSAIEAVGGFDETLPWAQDLDLWLRLCERFRADLVPEVLVRVNKDDRADRISANVPRTIRGRELYGKKHRDTLVRHRVLHVYLRETGWWQHHRAGDAAAARQSYRRSLAVDAVSPLTYVLFLATYVPAAWLTTMARLKHSLARLLSSRPSHAFSTLGWRRH